MKAADLAFRLALIPTVMALVVALVYVEYRSRNPEWKTFQKRGIALTIQRLEKDLADETERDKKREILSQIELLRNKQPEILEISPFGGKLEPERCMTCHFGIEDVSGSHPNSVFGCVTCHGGNAADLTVRGAHLGLRGGRSPAKLDLASASCGSNSAGLGKCHSEKGASASQSRRKCSAVSTGYQRRHNQHIALPMGGRERHKPQIRYQVYIGWRDQPQGGASRSRPTWESQTFRKPFPKILRRCHLWGSRHREKMGRMEGCPACHAPDGEDGRYEGVTSRSNGMKWVIRRLIP